jgi:hypothetical protein
MAYEYQVQRVTISGHCFGGAEEWSTGFYLGNETGDVGTATQTQVDNIAARWNTFFTASNSHINNNWVTNVVKVANHHTDGTTDPLNVVYHTYATPPVGAYAGSPFPAQCSVAATLRSSITRGRASKGRMFLPGWAGNLGSNGHMGSTDTTNLLATFRTFINGVNSDAAIGQNVILASFGRGTTPPPGINKLVSEVQIGDVVDTQRRRRDGFAEVYSTATIP